MWERTIELPPPRLHYQPLDAVRALGARPDGGVLIVVRAADGGGRLLAIDAAGKERFARPLPAPDGLRQPVLRSAAVNGEAADRIWLFLTWESGGDAAPRSQLLSIEADGTSATITRLPRHVPPGAAELDIRDIAVLRRLRDGSLVAGGTAYYGPPIWWYARFTTSGRLLHEAKSRRYPDYVEDAWGNADGGYTLLMVDAEGGQEGVTVRRFGADGRQVLRRKLSLSQSYRCAVLVGEMRQMRLQPRAVQPPGPAAPVEQMDVVVHDVDRGIVRRVELGPVGCSVMTRVGDHVVLAVLAAVEGGDGHRIVGLSGAGEIRWSLDLVVAGLQVTAMPDGGALVVQLQGNASARITRYRAP